MSCIICNYHKIKHCTHLGVNCDICNTQKIFTQICAECNKSYCESCYSERDNVCIRCATCIIHKIERNIHCHNANCKNFICILCKSCYRYCNDCDVCNHANCSRGAVCDSICEICDEPYCHFHLRTIYFINEDFDDKDNNILFRVCEQCDVKCHLCDNNSCIVGVDRKFLCINCAKHAKRYCRQCNKYYDGVFAGSCHNCYDPITNDTLNQSREIYTALLCIRAIHPTPPRFIRQLIIRAAFPYI